MLQKGQRKCFKQSSSPPNLALELVCAPGGGFVPQVGVPRSCFKPQLAGDLSPTEALGIVVYFQTFHRREGDLQKISCLASISQAMQLVWGQTLPTACLLPRASC